ncbi:unnamed protein product [Clavelina lepadiformis]|uniref:Uncharacterized protein n=1 Tax=Clavelina lepadiformis TaxID=159417 RepID=A0ABP0FSY3_CLALP
MAAVILLSVASNVFLPETRDQPLPQNVEDALKMKGLWPTSFCRGSTGGKSNVMQNSSSSSNVEWVKTDP